MTEYTNQPRIGVVGLPDNWSCDHLMESLRQRIDDPVLVEMDKVSFDLENGAVLQDGQDLAKLDALFVKKLGQEYSPHLLDRLEVLGFLQNQGVRIFSRPQCIQALLDRLACTVRLRQGGIPMPPTVITENIERAAEAVQRFGKVVLKPLYSTKARGMQVLEDGPGVKAALEQFQAAGNPVIYIQKFLPIPDRDYGLVFLGGKYLATYSRVASESAWNTTIHSGGKYEPHEPDPAWIQLADKAQSIFNLDFTCVDLVETDRGPMVFEVSAFGGFRGLKEAHNIDAAELVADYILKKLGHELQRS